jgi:hypothetical protein
MTEQTYSARSAATRAARKALGDSARPGHDFTVEEVGDRWTWAKKPTHTDPGAPPKERAPQSPANAAEPQPPAAPPVGAPAAAEAPGEPLERSASRKAMESGPPRAMPRVNKARAEAEAAADRGELPTAPDFSAETHKRFRPKLAELEALVAAGDVKALKAYAINPISTSPKALDRYRNLAVRALEAKGEPAL